MGDFCYTKLVMPQDLNPSNRLFGGKLLAWVDEASALYVMDRMQRKNIVTVSFDETVFKVPVKSGDILKFFCDISEVGNSSITTKVTVFKDEYDIVLESRVKFVTIDPDSGKSIPHNWSI